MTYRYTDRCVLLCMVIQLVSMTTEVTYLKLDQPLPTENSVEEDSKFEISWDGYIILANVSTSFAPEDSVKVCFSVEEYNVTDSMDCGFRFTYYNEEINEEYLCGSANLSEKCTQEDVDVLFYPVIQSSNSTVKLYVYGEKIENLTWIYVLIGIISVIVLGGLFCMCHKKHSQKQVTPTQETKAAEENQTTANENSSSAETVTEPETPPSPDLKKGDMPPRRLSPIQHDMKNYDVENQPHPSAEQLYSVVPPISPPDFVRSPPPSYQSLFPSPDNLEKKQS